GAIKVNPSELRTRTLRFPSRAHSSGPSECCFDFYTKRIPVSRIQIALHGVLYFRTSCRFCANSASFWIYFRLKTVKDVELCVNPADQSIQDLMEKVMWGQKVSSGQDALQSVVTGTVPPGDTQG
uniref:Uncharacterized protein n=2 Tax=Denticeps clupeoides TaxID=299321 RepID=A0AAY4B3P4_9TELE